MSVLYQIHSHGKDQAISSLMERSADGKGFICPACRHGKGGDGITFSDQGKFHCFACDRSGDAVDMYMLITGETVWKRAVIETAKMYGIYIPVDQQQPPAPQAPQQPQRNAYQYAQIMPQLAPQPFAVPPTPAISAHTLTETTRIRKDIDTAADNQNHPDFIAYLKKRGISIEVASRHNLGFIPNWQHPKQLAEGKHPPETPRVIIPTGDESYTARDIRENLPEDQKKYAKQKAGSTGILNKRAIRDSKTPIYIVEGEFDALSIIEVGASAVAIGGVSNIDTLIDELKRVRNEKRKYKQSLPLLIIAMDNDPAGRKASEKLANKLDEFDFKYAEYNPAGNYKDANEFLQADRNAFIKSVQEGERKEIYEQTNAGYLDALKAQYATTPEPIKTGFRFLDDLFDGGLFAGLYIIGGVSSSGKTALSMQIIDQVAAAGGDCLVFAAEMSRADLVARSISRETAILAPDPEMALSQRGVQSGFLYDRYTPATRSALDAAYSNYSKYAGRITVIENQGENMKPSNIRATVENYCNITRSRPVILIDYLQILTPENTNQDIRLAIDDTIRSLKGISSLFNLPIIVISSLNRDNYTAPLNLSAFKESGNIEYAADYLLGLQFSIVHTLDQGAASKGTNLEILSDEKKKPIRDIEITILKQRGGRSSGTVKFEYDAKHNLYKESDTIESYIQSNFTDLKEQQYHRERLTGHRISADDRPIFTTRKKAL